MDEKLIRVKFCSSQQQLNKNAWDHLRNIDKGGRYGRNLAWTLTPAQLSGGSVIRRAGGWVEGEPPPSVVLATRHLLKHDQSPAPPSLLRWRQLIPACAQRLGLAEWTKWQRSSWPRRLRPAEWFSLCRRGHRGLAEMGWFLRGHLAGLCSSPSNAATQAFPLGSEESLLWTLEKKIKQPTRRWHAACMSTNGDRSWMHRKQRYCKNI